MIISVGVVVLILCGSASIHAVYNGSPDGTNHPAVGFVLGTIGQDPCDYNAQAIGCSGVLIAPDVFLSTAECTDAVKNSIDTGFIDDGWIILDPYPLVAGYPEPLLDCTKMVHIESYDINPVYFSSHGLQGDVGVMILAAPQTITPATLPTLNRLKPHPKKKLPDITTASFGELADPGSPGGFDIFSLLRRFSHAAFGTITAETHLATFDPAPGPDPCIGFVARGGPTFVTGMNQVVSLAQYPATTCDTSAQFQRLDVPSARSFLSNYVSLP
ncbi:MAG: hypothetical protein ACREAA_10510 [Candidatus Polarisedimenticolia bacterium]